MYTEEFEQVDDDEDDDDLSGDENECADAASAKLLSKKQQVLNMRVCRSS